MTKFKGFLFITCTTLLFTGCNLFQSDLGGASVSSGQDNPAMVLSKTAAEPIGTECIEPPEGLIGFWPGDGTPKDYSGNYNHGVLVGDATFSEGYVEQAFKTDPMGDYVDISNSTVYDSLNELTLSAWIFVAENTYYPAIINKGNAETSDESFSLFLDPWGKLGLLLNSNGTSSGRTMYVGPQIPRNEWYFVTATYDGLWMKLYLDGAPIGQKLHFGGINTGGHNIILGIMEKNPDMLELPSLHGNIDEASIYNRALTEDEVLALYNAGHFGKCKDSSLIDPPPPPPVELTPEERIEEAKKAIKEIKKALIALTKEYCVIRRDITENLHAALKEAKKEKNKKLRRDMMVAAIKNARLERREARVAHRQQLEEMRAEIRANIKIIRLAKREIAASKRAERKAAIKARRKARS